MKHHRSSDKGFTLIELMIAVAIIGILAAIALPKFSNLVLKSHEAASRGNLAMLRSALSIYYGDNENAYPVDDLTSLASNQKYVVQIPILQTPNYHADSSQVTPETVPTDTGQWSYDNQEDDLAWGAIHVGCTHQDTHGMVWSSY